MNERKRFFYWLSVKYTTITKHVRIYECTRGEKWNRCFEWFPGFLNLVTTNSLDKFIFPFRAFSSINSLMYNIPKWSDTLWKSCSKCCKIFKVCLTILEHYALKGWKRSIILKLWNFKFWLSIYVTSLCLHFLNQSRVWGKFCRYISPPENLSMLLVSITLRVPSFLSIFFLY